MPKIKTHKAAVKRYTITKTGTILKRGTGQDHFNARESGNTKRNKRRDVPVAKAEHNNIHKLLPYN